MNSLPLVALLAVTLGCDTGRARDTIPPSGLESGDVTSALGDSLKAVIVDQATQIVQAAMVSDSLMKLVDDAEYRVTAAVHPRDKQVAWVRLSLAHANHAEALYLEAQLIRNLWAKNTLAMLIMGGIDTEGLPGVPSGTTPPGARRGP